MNTDNKMSTQEMVAGGVSLTILAAGLIYWSVQVYNAYSMLSLAYGW